jgi:F-type H+-transporting ATPase subunit delta
MASRRRTQRTARQLFRLCLVKGVLDDARVRKAVALAIASKRRGFTIVLTEFERLVRLDRERHSARIESAVPLPDQVRADLAAGVAKHHGPGIDTSFVENPALIGGVRVQVGSNVYDGSIRGRLEDIEARF